MQILTLDASPIVLVGRQEVSFVQNILTAMKKARHKSLKLQLWRHSLALLAHTSENPLQGVIKLLNDSYDYTRKFS